jgi:membrane protease YdiL (CAAX protease family)
MNIEGGTAPSTREGPHALAGEKGLLLLAAWVSIILASDIPNWLFSSLVGQVPGWINWGKAIVLLLFLAACLLSERLRPLTSYAIVIFVFITSMAIAVQVQASPWWQALFTASNPSFGRANLIPFIPDLGITLVVLVVLRLMHGWRGSFFLAIGDMQAPIKPVRWLGIGQGESWKVFGGIFTAAAALAVAIPTFTGMRAGVDLWVKVIPFIPVILLLSAINAFDEEVYYRMTLLSTLPKVVGKQQALLLNAFLFGMAHYYGGSPAGWVGVLMTGFLGWLLGKAMYETEGLAWPWIMHFVPDVVIFTSYALVWLRT